MQQLAIAEDSDTLSMTQLIRILNQRTIRSVKQPIINLREQRQIGFEALSRGIHPDTGTLIPPDQLFSSAREWGLTSEIDRLCVDNAFASFATYSNGNDMLFVNFDVASLENAANGNSWILDKATSLGLSPRSIAIEIVESRATSDLALMKFVEWHRKFGFLIVLDDFGTAHSNLDRLHMLKPDIVKIDQSLVQGVSNDHYKRSIVESILVLSEKIGALSLVEGVETIEDVLTCVTLGANLCQGHYFSEPISVNDTVDPNLKDRIDYVFDASVKMLQQQWGDAREEVKFYEEFITYFAAIITQNAKERLDQTLSEIMRDAVGVECAYIVDSNGIQVTETHFQEGEEDSLLLGTGISSPRGTNHFLKHYFLKMKTSQSQSCLTRPYVSLASGNICRTMGYTLTFDEEEILYLFVDFAI